MISGTGTVQQDHTSHEDRHRQKILLTGLNPRFYQQRYSCEDCHHHGDEMCNGTAGFSYCDLHNNSSFSCGMSRLRI